MNVKRNHNLDLWQNKTDTTAIAETVKGFTAENIRLQKGREYERDNSSISNIASGIRNHKASGEGRIINC